MIETPVARGLTVCEQIIVDQLTKNVSMINCSLGWSVSAFPSESQRFVVYASLTNGLGNGNMKIRIVNLRDGSIVYEQSTPLRFQTPLVVIRFAFRVRHCEFPEPGSYEVSLLADDELVADCVLNIKLTEAET